MNAARLYVANKYKEQILYLRLVPHICNSTSSTRNASELQRTETHTRNEMYKARKCEAANLQFKVRKR